MATRAIEQRIADVLSKALRVTFDGAHYLLDGWGEADDSALLSPSARLLLEVETSQKHPNTNVLKVWPYLDAHNELSVILIQTYFEDSPGLRSNQGKLADWTASKMEDVFGSRFRYVKLIFSSDFEPTGDFGCIVSMIESTKGDP